MKTTIATIVLAVMLATSVPVSAGNPEQSGTTTDCLDYLVLYLVPEVESPFAETVVVEGATGYTISEDAVVDFFDEGGNSVGYTGDGEHDEVTPADATYGIVCVFVGGEVPGPGDYTYQDGL